jgi:hypothetical protein
VRRAVLGAGANPGHPESSRGAIGKWRALLGVLLLAACADPNGTPRTYSYNDARLAVGNAARMSCSCLFVMKMPDEFCHAWVAATPAVARYSVDKNAKTVEASALVSWSARARFVDEKHGCLLE